MRNLCLVMAGLVGGGTFYAAVNDMGAGLIAAGTAVAILNIFAYAMWDDIGRREAERAERAIVSR